MATMQTRTISVTIDAPFERVVADLVDPSTHPEWATRFFAGPAVLAEDGMYEVDVPTMGGRTRVSVEADVGRGVIDVFLAPAGAPFGPPLPIRVLPNGDGADVLFTLARLPGMTDQQWTDGIAGMEEELQNLKARHEQ
jgi:hypothetical protein